ncbi:replication initiation factor domain-containing protein [Chromobacterium sp. IIBBL 290-4]|uniref:replication initiation factor domain-containing protein n=1 Tax=Chromobacterium sp. IIBBL 290-4 TaxID=2953890 RepID=UPI0020B81831|nr:replication initiation factor domain-containing protein [Chromobacterium sp. IIBBL 290-4]UTH73577.1 replication initiation factor domain-containing protein [Chromobacterium sp. IIBBL 290-4]
MSTDLHADQVEEAFRLDGFHIADVRAKFGYRYAFSVHCESNALTDAIVTVYHGGDSQRGTMMFERSGPLAAKAAALLVRLFGAEAFRLSRGDVCVDLNVCGLYREGREFLLSVHENWNTQGQRGAKPKLREISDGGTGAGNTFYMGSGDVHMFRMYEKGKQLKRADLAGWVRAEVQLRPKGTAMQLIAWQSIVKGLFMDIWAMTPYARFSSFFLATERSRLQVEPGPRDTRLDTRAQHFIRQYYGLMQELIGAHAHGDWSQLGDIVLMLKRRADATAGFTCPEAGEAFAEYQRRIQEDCETTALLISKSSDGSHNLYYVKSCNPNSASIVQEFQK